MGDQNILESRQKQNDGIHFLLERRRTIVFVQNDDGDSGERIGGETRRSPIRHSDVELEALLLLVVESGDGPERSRALVDGKILLRPLLQDLVRQKRVDSGIGIRCSDHQRIEVLLEEDERSDGGRFADVSDEVGFLEAGLVVVDV